MRSPFTFGRLEGSQWQFFTRGKSISAHLTRLLGVDVSVCARERSEDSSDTILPEDRSAIVTSNGPFSGGANKIQQRFMSLLFIEVRAENARQKTQPFKPLQAPA